METSNIKVWNELRLPDIIKDLERGRIKIPRFQREFVWNVNKVIQLLDSIYQEFPIGSFFFWRVGPEFADHFRNVGKLGLPTETKRGELDFIIDGQQRITSLYVTYRGRKIGDQDYSLIGFDLEHESFVSMRSGKKIIVEDWEK